MIRLLALLVILAGPATAAAASVVYVKADATGSGNGASWADACTTLQAGLALAGSGDQVWVSQGTYKPGATRASTFTVPDGVAVYGGFVGGESALSQRRDDPGLCVLSGEIGAAGYADNVRRLVTMAGSGRLDTLTVTLASYDGASLDDAAGLVAVASGTDIAVVRCRFHQNRAAGPQLILIKNAATALINRCEITSNSELTFSQRSAGSVWFKDVDSATFTNSVITDLTPASVLDFQTAVLLTGIRNYQVSNCVFARCNTIDVIAFGGFESADAPNSISGCTFFGNRARNQMGGSLRNCIIGPTGGGTTLFGPTHNENNWLIATDGDPRFVNSASLTGADGLWLTDDDGLRLQPTSPCIDRARFITATSSLAMPQSDILGTPRPQGRQPDCGAYEYPTGNAGPFATAQALQVREDSLTPIVLSGSDADGDALTAQVLSLPVDGVLLPTIDGTTASGPALTSVPYLVTNPGRVVLFRPAGDIFGAAYASFTFVVHDGQVDSDPATVALDVLSVNDPPTIDAPADRTVLEDSGQTVVALTGIGAGTPALPAGNPSREVQVLAITATSSDPAVIPDPTVAYISPAATATLLFAPVANAHGTVTISVSVQDDGGLANGGTDTTVATFTVTVLPVNDPPRLDAVADVVLPEDCSDPGLTTLTITGISVGPADESAQGLDLIIVSSDTAVVGASCDYTPGASTAQIELHPVADASGSALVFVSLFDTGGSTDGGEDSSVRVFTVQVTPVEDPPVLAVNAGQTAITSRTTSLDGDRLRLTDADAPPAASLVFSLATIPASGTLRRSGIDLTAGGTFSQADLDAGLLEYAHNGDSTATDAFTVTWSDGNSPSQGPATVTVTLTGNALPVIAIPGPGSSWTEGPTPAEVAPTATVSDADPLPWDRGGITASIWAGGAASDVLSLAHEGAGAGEVGVVGQVLTFGGLEVGTWSGGSLGTPLAVAFTTVAATPAAAQAVVRRLRFSNTGGNPGISTRTIRVVVNDGAAGASVPADASVAVVPIDDPPAVTTSWLALPAGITVETSLGVGDPDSSVFTWTLVGTPALAEVTLVDASLGRLRITPHVGASGREQLHVTISDLDNPPVAATVELVVTGLDDARPHPAGELPPDAYANGLLDTILRFDCSDLGGTAGLSFLPSADAPTALTLDPVGSDQVRVRWLVPAGGGTRYQRFGVIAIDPARQAAGLMPVQILILPQPGGGG